MTCDGECALEERRGARAFSISSALLFLIKRKGSI